MATYESRRYNTPVTDVTKVADGSVSNTEFEHLDGVTSDIQTQLNAKLSLSGGALTGALSTNNNISLGDNDHLYIGDGQDIDILSDGSTGFIKGNDLRLQSSTGENYMTALIDGSVELMHDNINRLQTTGSGVTVSGVMAATTLTGDGSALTALNGSNISSGTIPSARVSGIARAVTSTTIRDLVAPAGSATGTAPDLRFGSSQTGASVTVDVTNIDYVTISYGMEAWIATAPTTQNYCTSFTSAQIRVLRSGSGSAYQPTEGSLEFIDNYDVNNNANNLYWRRPIVYNFVYEQDVSGLSGNVTYTNDMRACHGVALSGAYSGGNYNTTAPYSGNGTNPFDVRSYSNWLQIVGH